MLNNEKKKKSMFFQELLVRLYNSHYLFIWLFHNVFFLQCSYNDRPLISQAWTCVDDQTVALFQIACKTMSHSAASFFSSVKMCLMETQVRKSSHVMNGLRRSFLHKDTEYTCIFSSWAAGENRKYNLFGYFFPRRQKQRLIPTAWSSSSPLNCDSTSSLPKMRNVQNATALIFSQNQRSAMIDWAPFSVTSVHYENLLLFHDTVTITRCPGAVKRWLPWAISASSHSTFLWITSAVSIVWQKPGTGRNSLTLCTPAVR